MSAAPPALHVALLGMMGSGKTAVGQALAARLGRPFLDNDTRFLARYGRTPAEVAASEGAEALHEKEGALLKEALATPTPAVIAAPGGAVLDAELRVALGAAFRVWLDASPETLARRILSAGHRPFLGADIPEALRALDRVRRPLFEALAQLMLPMDAPGFTVEEAVERTVAALPPSPAGRGP